MKSLSLSEKTSNARLILVGFLAAQFTKMNKPVEESYFVPTKFVQKIGAKVVKMQQTA